jgi:HTH-type transcriptional regulator/antitoxin HipB
VKCSDGWYSDVLQHGLAAIAEARRLHGGNLQDAASRIYIIFQCLKIILYACTYKCDLYAITYIFFQYAIAYIAHPRRPDPMKQSARTTKQLGAILRRARRNAKLTQTELGKRIGLRQATVSKLESGEPATQLSTLLDTLTALGLELSVDTRSKAAGQDLGDLF